MDLFALLMCKEARLAFCAKMLAVANFGPLFIHSTFARPVRCLTIKAAAAFIKSNPTTLVLSVPSTEPKMGSLLLYFTLSMPISYEEDVCLFTAICSYTLLLLQ